MFFRHLEARVINTDVQLLWSPPKLPMGYTRTNIWYIVQCKDCPRNNAAFGSDGLSKSLRLSDLPFHVKGLRPETRYQFEVFSMNSITENSLSLADYEVAIVTTQKEGWLTDFGVRTFRPIQFQPMQFQPLPFQPLTISTYCIFNRPQFRPKLILANGS